MKYLRRILAITYAFLLLAVPTQVSAAAVTMSLSPSAGSVQQNSNFTVNVNLSTGSAGILDVLATVNFDASKVQYVSTSYSPSGSWGSPGPSSGDVTASSKTIDVTKNSTAPTGNLTIATITFKALASSGSASFSISGASVGDADTPPPAEHTVSASGTSVAFTAAPAPATPAPSSSTKTPAQSAALPTTEEAAVNAQLDDDQPVPVTAFQDGTGYAVEVVVRDKSGKGLADVEVVLGEQKARTNSEGIASFTGVVAGTYTVSAADTELSVEVVVGDATITQTFELTVKEASNVLIYVAIGGAALLVIAILVFIMLRRGKGTPDGHAFSGGTPSSFTTPGPTIPNTPVENNIDSKLETFAMPRQVSPGSTIQPNEKA